MQQVCSSCGFDCTGVNGDICPECGRATITSQRQAVYARRVARARSIGIVLLILLTAAPPAAGLVALVQSGNPLVVFGLFVAIVAVSPGIALLIATWFTSYRRPLTRKQDNAEGMVTLFTWGWIIVSVIGESWWFVHVYA